MIKRKKSSYDWKQYMPQEIIPKFSDLAGKTLTHVEFIKGDYHRGLSPKPDRIRFRANEEIYELYHGQNCCEEVRVEDICGDLQDLVGSPILQAEESSNANERKAHTAGITFIFYRIATMKGSVVIRWSGSSNGWYSESVDFKKL